MARSSASAPAAPAAWARSLGGAVLFAALLAAAPSMAQQQRPAARPAAPAAAPAAPAPTPAEPQSTTASFADWTLRCQRQEGRPQLCDINQSVTSGGRPVAQIAVGRPAAGAPMRLTFAVVPNVTVDAPLRLLGPGTEGEMAELTWRRCAPGGCIADAPATDAFLARFSAQTENGKLVFRDAAGGEADIPLSPRGFTQALAALERG